MTKSSFESAFYKFLSPRFTNFESAFYKFCVRVLQILSPRFTNFGSAFYKFWVRVLQIFESAFYKSSPVRVLQYAVHVAAIAFGKEACRNFCPCRSQGQYCSSVCDDGNSLCLNNRSALENNSDDSSVSFLLFLR